MKTFISSFAPVVGMSLLAVSLSFVLCVEVIGIGSAAGLVRSFGSIPPGYVAANALGTVRAIVPILPSALGQFERFVVLQIFLSISGAPAYWQPDETAYKIGRRLTLSLLAVGYLRMRGEIDNFIFRWSLLGPRFFVRTSRSGDARALAVGLEILGLGYAFSSMVALTIASLILMRSFPVAWPSTRRRIFCTWAGLSGGYSLLGVTILIARSVSVITLGGAECWSREFLT